MLHDSSNSRTDLLVRHKSLSIHEAAKIMPPQAGIEGGGTNKPSKVSRVAGVELVWREIAPGP